MLTTNSGLGTWSRCCSGLAALSRGAAKAAKAKLRQVGVFREAGDWVRKATICETCPMRVVHAGTTYCGKPFLHLPVRDSAEDGCGCPTMPKAKDPTEHCPLDARHQPARTSAAGCDCKWCTK